MTAPLTPEEALSEAWRDHDAPTQATSEEWVAHERGRCGPGCGIAVLVDLRKRGFDIVPDAARSRETALREAARRATLSRHPAMHLKGRAFRPCSCVVHEDLRALAKEDQP